MARYKICALRACDRALFINRARIAHDRARWCTMVWTIADDRTRSYTIADDRIRLAIADFVPSQYQR